MKKKIKPRLLTQREIDQMRNRYYSPAAGRFVDFLSPESSQEDIKNSQVYRSIEAEVKKMGFPMPTITYDDMMSFEKMKITEIAQKLYEQYMDHLSQPEP